MTDKYIINPSTQQGQPQNSKGAVGSANVVETIGGHVPEEDRVDEALSPLPEHADIPGIHPIPPAHGAGLKDNSRRSMGEKIGK